jgi:hypothetical protein
MVSIKRILIALLVVFCIPLVVPIIYLALIPVSFIRGANLTADADGIKTKYVFTFDNGKVVRIQDDHSRIVRSWDGSPDSISIENGVRTVRFSEGAILKTSVDSVEPHPDYVKVKGYMGIWTDDKEFIVGRDGEISSTEWAN